MESALASGPAVAKPSMYPYPNQKPLPGNVPIYSPGLRPYPTDDFEMDCELYNSRPRTALNPFGAIVTPSQPLPPPQPAPSGKRKG